MLTPQRPPHHTRDAEIGLVELSQFQQLVDNAFLTVASTGFGNETWVFHHSFKVEVAAKTVEDGEEDVEERMIEE